MPLLSERKILCPKHVKLTHYFIFCAHPLYFPLFFPALGQCQRHVFLYPTAPHPSLIKHLACRFVNRLFTHHRSHLWFGENCLPSASHNLWFIKGPYSMLAKWLNDWAETSHASKHLLNESLKEPTPLLLLCLPGTYHVTWRTGRCLSNWWLTDWWCGIMDTQYSVTGLLFSNTRPCKPINFVVRLKEW